MKGKILMAAALWVLFGFGGISHADHQGPERIVEGKYTVILSILPEENNSLKLRFFFNDSQNGRPVSDITATLSIADEKGVAVLAGRPVEVKNGVGEVTYIFPAIGLFEIALEFKKNGEAHIYRPEPWSIWAPGESGAGIGASYPLGLSEVASIALAIFAVVLIAWSFMANRKNRNGGGQK